MYFCSDVFVLFYLYSSHLEHIYLMCLSRYQTSLIHGMTSVAMTASSKPMVSAIALAAKRFSSVPRWCTHHLVSRRFLHRAMERHNKPLCMNTAAPFGSVHFCHMRASSTASAPSAVGFDNYDHEVKNFKLHVPEYFNFASDVIDVWAEKQASIMGMYLRISL